MLLCQKKKRMKEMMFIFLSLITINHESLYKVDQLDIFIQIKWMIKKSMKSSRWLIDKWLLMKNIKSSIKPDNLKKNFNLLK